ncbi:TPA: hypothetical protein MM329_000690 [Escherichia coli]|nr:hypothetical protein [Escherichia coli]HBZ8229056.1 hypothetical protein [Escherichia coli]HBZ8345784.1 hypothetical protein [Escherichia coli]HBZ8350853.1 hypothetical protein [Escherichia coli]HBZ8356185.1 hypothetical protein [Escherichia coli]
MLNNEKEQAFIKIINEYEMMVENLRKENKSLSDITKFKTKIIAKQNLTIKFLQEVKK